MAKDTKAIFQDLYPLVDKALSSSKIRNNYKKYVNDFFAKRDTEVYDALPCSRILCGEDEMDRIFAILEFPKQGCTDAISKTYYSQISNFNPKAALHEFTVTQLSVIRYFGMKNMKKEQQTAMLMLAFSGKFYPSLHYRSYPTVVPARHIMEYVVNNNLSQKYDLAAHGSVIGAIESIGMTWLETYKNKFKSFADEDVVYLIQQLHSRIGSFMKNIAEEYYKAYEDKDSYMAYSSDSYDSEDFHIADNDSLKTERLAELVMNRITSNGIDYKIAKACSDENITPNEAKAVIESITMNKENLPEIKELVSLMIATYFATHDDKDCTNISFITFTVAPKPNAKQQEIVRQKEIVEHFLSESGTAYMRRRSRIATKNSYERCVKMYFALIIHDCARHK